MVELTGMRLAFSQQPRYGHEMILSCLQVSQRQRKKPVFVKCLS